MRGLATKGKVHRHRMAQILCLVLFLISGTIIVALLLGSKAGSFVIRVQDGTVNESIMVSLKRPEEDPEGKELTKLLNAPGVSNVNDTTASLFITEGFETLNEFTKDGGLYVHYSDDAVSLYTYTFFIINTGSRGVNVEAEMNYNTNEHSKLDDICRIMTFRTDSLNQSKEVAKIYKKADDVEAIIPGYLPSIPVNNFYGDSIVFKGSDERIFIPYKDYVKYSIIFWLEGNDPDSMANAEEYLGSTIKFDLTVKVIVGEQ